MSKYQAPHDVPGEVGVRYWCRNTEPVTSGLNYLTGRALQHVRAYRKKQMFLFSADLSMLNVGGLFHEGPSAPASASGSREWYVFMCHTGYGTTHLVFETHVAPCTSSLAEPWLQWSVVGGGEFETATNAPAAGTIQALAFSNLKAAGQHRTRSTANGTLAVDPAQWTMSSEAVPVLENTAYVCTLRVHGDIRPIGGVVYELGEEILDRGDPGVPNVDDGYRAPILDSRWEQTVRAGTALWKRNAPPVFVQSREPVFAVADGSPCNPFTVEGTTWTNIHDDTTAVAAASVGFAYDLTDMASVRGDGVPCRLAVLAESEAGGSAELRLQNSSGTVVSITGMDAAIPTWYVKDFLITTLDDKVDIQARNDTASTDAKIHSVSLLQLCMERTFPDRVDQWDHNFVGIGRRPQGMWPCQGDGTNGLEDMIRNQPLSESGTADTITYEVAVTDPHRAVGVQIDEGGYFEAGDGAFMDAHDDVSGAVRLFVPETISTTAQILGKRGATGAGYYLAVETDGNIILHVDDGTSTVTSTVAEDFRGRWVDVIWAIDVAGDALRVWAKGVIAGSTTVKGSDTDSIAALGSLSSKSETFKLGGGGEFDTADGMIFTWACVHDAYALSDDDRDILRSPDFIAQEGRILP